VGHVPLVVVRDRDGVLRAIVNVCRHRGAEVVAGSGRCTTLQCHYHAWTYGLDGALRAAPRSEADPDFDREELALRPAQVDTWGPFIFVNADAGAAPLAETLGSLPDIVRTGGIDVDAVTFQSRAPYSLAANCIRGSPSSSTSPRRTTDSSAIQPSRAITPRFATAAARVSST
jgi:phenylpropionate dioxygenase-like ring-hydroxylating dioxygenase large terminal subunit